MSAETQKKQHHIFKELMQDLHTAHIFKKAKNIFVAIILCLCFVPSAIAQSLFAAIGDYGDRSADEGNVAGLVYSWNPDFIITAGDNRYGSRNFDETVGQFYCDSLSEAGNGTYCTGSNSSTNAFFPSLGNHDYNDGDGLIEYLGYFTLPGAGVETTGTSGSERYYDFIRGPVHFFVIDSQGALTSTPDKNTQINWLRAHLAASNAPWQIVYLHHAPYSSAAVHGSNTAMQWPFASWGADAVIAGHDHTYERIFAAGIVYFVNGLGGRSIYDFGIPVPGSQVRYNDDYGAMRVNASDLSITFEFISTSGNIIDTYTIKNAAPSAAFTYSCTNLDCNFTETSADSDGSVTDWDWNFGDGNSASTQNPAQRYAAAGTYTVSLTVTDNNGAMHSTERLVTVTANNDTAAPQTGGAGGGGGCSIRSHVSLDGSWLLMTIGFGAGFIRQRLWRNNRYISQP
jgi:tartrate-resistant acid phosphatase type 5